MPFKGGEAAALARVQEYIWDLDLLKEYKETRELFVWGGGELWCMYLCMFHLFPFPHMPRIPDHATNVDQHTTPNTTHHRQRHARPQLLLQVLPLPRDRHGVPALRLPGDPALRAGARAD